MNHCCFQGVSKIAILKVSVGLIVVQGIITQLVIALNKVTLSSDSNFSSNERAIRLYCFIVLLEYLFVSTAMFVSFGSEITPSAFTGAREDPQAFSPVSWSFSEFVCAILSVQDIFGTTNPGHGDLSTSLAANKV